MTPARRNGKSTKEQKPAEDAAAKVDYAEMKRRREEEHRKAVERNMIAEAPVVEDLRRAGYRIDSLEEIINSREVYRSAIPVLLKWLPIVAEIDIKLTIVQALTVRWAKREAAKPLTEEFRKMVDLDYSYRWPIVSALEVMADDSMFEDIAELLRDKRHGRAREMLAMALGKMKKEPRAADLAIELLDDEEVAGHALVAVRKLKATKARAKVEQFLNHPKAWVRAEARKAVAKFDKA